jgi:hypothetical protein
MNGWVDVEMGEMDEWRDRLLAWTTNDETNEPRQRE